MKCDHCNSEWNAGANVSSSATCPFCGKSLVKEENPKFENSKDALAYIMDKHGVNILLSEKIKAYFSDYAPSVPQNQKGLVYAVYEKGAAKVLKANLNASQADKEIAIKIAIRNLTDAFIVQDAAENIIYEFIAAIGWQVDRSLPVPPPEVSKPVSPPEAPKPVPPPSKEDAVQVLPIIKKMHGTSTISSGSGSGGRGYGISLIKPISTSAPIAQPTQTSRTDPEQERIKQEKRQQQPKYNACISAGAFHTVALKTDGTVVAVGNNDKGQCNTGNWHYIEAVATGASHTVALKEDGRVVAVGNNEYGQCKFYKTVYELTNDMVKGMFKGNNPNRPKSYAEKLIEKRQALNNPNMAKSYADRLREDQLKEEEERKKSWEDIVAVSAGNTHTIGLKKDGIVLAVGNNSSGQCNISKWDNIVAVSAKINHTIGLKKDGTVVAVGDTQYGQCNTGSWRDIVALSTSGYHTVGLKADGTVVAVGNNDKGQCNTSGWHDIVAVGTGGSNTVALKADGAVLVVGDNQYGQCNIGGWRNIIAVSTSGNHTVELKADGTVVAVGRNEESQCNTGGWRNIGPLDKVLLAEQKAEEKKIEDEQRAAKQKEWDAERKAADQRYFDEQHRIHQSNMWKAQGLCPYCGGQFGGLFTKKCKDCGKEQ